VTVLAAPEPVSPELVLVSPPEAARIARLLLPEPHPAVPEPHAEPAGPRPIELVVAYLVCFAATVGPMAAFLLLR
jgi:hypothetical protein